MWMTRAIQPFQIILTLWMWVCFAIYLFLCRLFRHYASNPQVCSNLSCSTYTPHNFFWLNIWGCQAWSSPAKWEADLNVRLCHVSTEEYLRESNWLRTWVCKLPFLNVPGRVMLPYCTYMCMCHYIISQWMRTIIPSCPLFVHANWMGMLGHINY